MKRCTRCGVLKDDGAFSRDAQKSTGLRSDCRECVKLRPIKLGPRTPRYLPGVPERACRECGAAFRPQRDRPNIYCSRRCSIANASRWPGLTTEERFWQKVEPEPMSGCWLWTGAWMGRSGYSYGSFAVAGDGATLRVLAHRYAYELLRGAIPDDLVIDHVCRTPPCVNPWHLEPVTAQVNSLRGARAHFRLWPRAVVFA